jgi:solute carrier family 12 (potassium/chloride transporters), member 9
VGLDLSGIDISSSSKISASSRPQMLLFVANPRSSIDLIDFVNDMKKGGLFILGHVKVNDHRTNSDDICAQVYPFWIQLIDHMKIKAFVDMTSAANIRDGVQQLIRLSGLGKQSYSTYLQCSSQPKNVTDYS